MISVSSVSAVAGSTGNTLEVDLTNTGASAVTFGGFAFGISTNSPDIDFTNATTATTQPYIFAADSAFGPNITLTAGQSLTAADNSLSGADGVAAGATVGLGEVFFDVAPSASLGPIPVTLAPFSITSLSDNNGGNLLFTPSNGTITVEPLVPSVPEPSTLLLLSSGLALLATRFIVSRDTINRAKKRQSGR